MNFRMTQAPPNANFSDNKETKKIVTPFAFGVHDSLLGMRLASPKRRLAAFLVDFICIGLLTQLDGYWLSVMILGIAATTLFRLRNDGDKPWLKISLMLVAALAVLTILFQTMLSNFIGSRDSNGDLTAASVETQSLMKAKAPLTFDGRGYELEIASLLDEDKDVICKEGKECDSAFFVALSNDLIKKGIKFDKANRIYDDVKALLDKHDRLDSDSSDASLAQSLYESRFSKTHAFKAEGSSSGSIVNWVKGILGDLGLSFGWAAVYFSVLTAWWRGQTIGKRMFGIKVVRIDGGDIDLWESIGRYGGYSAGLATGLLGFIQVYWDANRQAIQDKISETLVVRP